MLVVEWKRVSAQPRRPSSPRLTEARISLGAFGYDDEMWMAGKGLVIHRRGRRGSATASLWSALRMGSAWPLASG
jgi:hypothetical protein